ncbi:hypothetical protein AB5N19_03577 [Seiridium cardinale]
MDYSRSTKTELEKKGALTNQNLSTVPHVPSIITFQNSDDRLQRILLGLPSHSDVAAAYLSTWETSWTAHPNGADPAEGVQTLGTNAVSKDTNSF